MLNQTTEQTNNNITNNIKKQCTGCAKFRTCLIIKGTTQLIQQHFTPETQPFNPPEMAQICTQYLNQSTVTQLITNLNNEENQK